MENLSNGYQTTLNGAITSGATSLVVTSATGAPAANFRLLIDNEIILVTAVSGTTFTITRGVESTTAAAHSSGVTVTQIITLQGLLNYIHENYPTNNLIINSHANPIVTATPGSTVTFDCSSSDWFQITPNGDCTFAFSNVQSNQQITLRIIGDGTAHAITYPGTIIWFTSDGLQPTYNSTSGKVTVLTFKQTSSGNYDGFVVGTQV